MSEHMIQRALDVGFRWVYSEQTLTKSLLPPIGHPANNWASLWPVAKDYIDVNEPNKHIPYTYVYPETWLTRVVLELEGQKYQNGPIEAPILEKEPQDSHKLPKEAPNEALEIVKDYLSGRKDNYGFRFVDREFIDAVKIVTWWFE